METISTLDKDIEQPLPKIAVRKSTQKTPLWRSWFRSHIASLLATGTDFMVTIGLTEAANLWYVLSNVMGALAGGVVSFSLCRWWVFNIRKGRWQYQAFRYLLAIGLSLTMNTLGVWFLTETYDISYIFSKIFMAGIVGVTVNFLVFRYFVFK